MASPRQIRKTSSHKRLLCSRTNGYQKSFQRGRTQLHSCEYVTPDIRVEFVSSSQSLLHDRIIYSNRFFHQKKKPHVVTRTLDCLHHGNKWESSKSSSLSHAWLCLDTRSSAGNGCQEYVSILTLNVLQFCACHYKYSDCVAMPVKSRST